jgi:polysaccharide chain length determinant protein (PEP-CTERM system associated)
MPSENQNHSRRLIDIVWRRKWWIVVPTTLALGTSLAMIALTPKVYRASTTILMTQQSVPEDIVRSTVTLRMEERMRGLQVQILSRSYIEQIAREFAMIPANAGDAEIEKTCRTLSAHIIPEVDSRDYAWLRISVEDGDPQRAARIANRLADLFVEQNSKMRASQAAGTLEATGGWQEKYRLELSKRDAEISEFKQQNANDLPEQQAANLEFLNGAQNRLMQLSNDLRLQNDRLVALKTQQPPLPEAPGAAPLKGETRLATSQRELAELLLTYTEDYPLVKRKREEIAELLRAPSPATEVVSREPVSVQIASVENNIRELERDRAQEQAKIESYRAHIARAPQIQQQLNALTRDYDQVKHQFDTAVLQTEQAQRSQDLEGSNKAQQFQIQDRAYPTTVPQPPKLQYPLAVLLLGLLISASAIALLELFDQTVRSEEEFAVLFPDLPICGVIPNLDVDRKPGRSS